MSVQIPIEDTAYQSFLISLGGVRYRFSVWWQPEPDESWYVSVETVAGSKIASARRLVAEGLAIDLVSFGTLKMSGATTPTRSCWKLGTHSLIWSA